MFKNRAVEVKLVKQSTQPDAKVLVESIDMDKLSELVKDQVQNAAVVIGGAYAAKKAVDTLSELILIAGRRYL